MPTTTPRRKATPLRSALLCALLTAFGPAAMAQAPAAAAVQPYQLASGPLGRALAKVAVDAGLALSFDPALTDGLQHAPLNGVYVPREALARLLGGSGLELVARADGSFTLRKAVPQKATSAPSAAPATLAEVTVIASADAAPGELPAAYAGGQLARGARLGMLGNVGVMDTPFNVTSFTAQAIADQQASTIADVAARDASVRSTAPSGDVADAFFIRGFAIGDNNIGEIAFDGLFGVAPNYRLMADYAERVEVLKGPSAMLYGMSPNSGVGGSINVVPKRAGEDLLRVRADRGAGSHAGGHVDAARRFGQARQFGARVNASYHDGDTAVDHQSRRASLAALALDYQGERLRATLDLIEQREDVDAPSRRPFLGAQLAVPPAPDGRRNITQRWEWYDSEERSALLRAEYEAHRQLTVFASAGAASSEVARLFNTPAIVNAAGDTSVVPTRAAFDIERSAFGAGMRTRFSTGPVAHRATLEWSRYDDRVAMGTVAGRAYSSNLYTPLPQPAQDVAAPSAVPRRSANRLDGVALADVMTSADERVQVMLGLRRQQVRSDTFTVAGLRSAHYDESAVTPMAAVLFKPFPQLSLYANHVEGLSKGDIAPDSAVNAGEAFAPYKAKQQEIGAKVDHGSLITSVSLFQIARPSGQLTNNRFAADGEQRNRGLELSAYGAPGSGLRLHGGLTVIDADLVRTSSAATRGKRAVGVPDLYLTVSGEWDVPQLAGLTVTGAVVHSGEQFANQANTQRLASWTTFDAGARYRLRLNGKALTLRASVRNLGGKQYWAGASTWGTLSAGAPRSLLLSAAVDL